MHGQQTEATANTIIQSSGGLSLINIQWAFFTTGATAVIVCALLFVSVIICCWIRTKNIRKTETCHAQLLDVLRRPSGRAEPVSEPDPRFPRPVLSRTQSSKPSSAPDKWLRTPTGWTSVPEAYQLPASSQYWLPQLPFPLFPPVVYHGGHQPFSKCGFPGCGRDPQCHESLPYRACTQLEFRKPRFTEIDSASNTLKRRSSRVVERAHEVPRPAPVEPQAVQYRLARPQPCPRSQQASD